MNQCEVRNIFSEKGKFAKIIKSFKLSFHEKLAFNKERRNCTTKICKAFLKVDENDKVIFDESKLNNNNHVSLSEKVINRQKISNSLKIKTVTEALLCERPSKLLHAELRHQK